MGLHQDRGRARQARHQYLGDPHAAAGERARARSSARRSDLERVPQVPAHGILALDFLTVETVVLRTLYVLFAIHMGSRRVHVLGVTMNPDSAWVTQQARNLAVEERLRDVRFVIRDRDSKFSGPFDEVFRSEGVSIVKTPIRAPGANAFAERWVRTVRTECLDWTLVLGCRHLQRVLRAYAAHYNGRRPHQGLELKTPQPSPGPVRWPAAESGRVRTHDVLGGLIREYELAA
jgi:putative transposase